MSQRVLLILAGALALLWLPWPQPHQMSDRAHGIALGLFASDPNFDYGDLIDELISRGASDILIVIPWTQQDIHSTQIELGDPGTPSQATITRTLNQAKATGRRVALMPIVRLRDQSGGAWRGQIDAEPTAWFTSYRRALLPLAERRVDRLIIGSELGRMSRHDAQWRQTITQVRQVFHGQITYSSNWDMYADIPFWDALDAVGMTGYFPLSDQQDPTPAELIDAWQRPLADARRFAANKGLPLIWTEVGYPDHEDAAARPWDRHASEIPAPALQARLLTVACTQIIKHDGIYLWNWFGFGGSQDRGYSPRGKPAAAAIEACLR